jgi:hypothetical protein
MSENSGNILSPLTITFTVPNIYSRWQWLPKEISHHISVQLYLCCSWYCTFPFYRCKVTSRYSTAYSIKLPSPSPWRAISVKLSFHASRQRSKRMPVTQRQVVCASQRDGWKSSNIPLEIPTDLSLDYTECPIKTCSPNFYSNMLQTYAQHRSNGLPQNYIITTMLHVTC